MTQRITWLNELVRLEILLWDKVDAELRASHGMTMGTFEALYELTAAGTPIRVGDLAQAMEVTVGGTSKLVDRIEASGLLRREPDPADRRASRLAITPLGQERYREATVTYDKVVAEVLDASLTVSEQELIGDLIGRLLRSARAQRRPA